MRRAIAAIILMGCALVIQACAWPSDRSGAAVPIRVDNETTVPVGVYVNGRWLGTYPAGSSAAVPLGEHAEPPLSIELRSPSDAVLLSLSVNDGQLAAGAAGGYASGNSVGLPCGVLSVVVGTLGDNEALAPAASVEPGACP